MDPRREISFHERHLQSGEQVLAETLVLEIFRAHMDLSNGVDALLRDHGLTSAQYGVLRVLRDAGPEGLTCQLIAGKLLGRDPDITRLTDKLEEAGLVVKRRSEVDRRAMQITITAEGLYLLSELDAPMAELHVQQTARLTLEEKTTLTDLLARMLERKYCLPIATHPHKN